MLRTHLPGTVALVACFGCAPALSSFTPAHVAEKHHVQAEAGFDVSIPAGGLVDLWKNAKELPQIAHTRELTDEEKERLFKSAAGLALNPPSANAHLGVAYTPWDHFEVNGRLVTGAWRVGGRYQILNQNDAPLDLTASLGGGHYSYEFPISDQIPLVNLEDYSRWQGDLGVLAGRHGTWYRFWFGPKLMLTKYGTELTFDQPPLPSGGGGERVLASLDGHGTYLAGQVGAALGYKYVFIGFELTVAKFWTTAQLQLLNREREAELDNTIVSPGLALMLEL